jgi:hypothetical protein
MGTGYCYGEQHVGVWASGLLGEEYVLNRLRDLVHACALRTSHLGIKELADGFEIVGDIDYRNPRDRDSMLKVRDRALAFLQSHTAEGFYWRIDKGDLVLWPKSYVRVNALL